MTSFRTIEGRASAEIEEKKSRFIAHCAHVETEQEALDFLEEIRSEHRLARHNVYAYVLRGDGATPRIRYSDDGEPQKTAGMPTLETIRHADLTDVIVVVTRYFGGTLLGTGGLVRAYTRATQAGLAAAEQVVISRCVDIVIRIPYPLYDQMVLHAANCEAKLLDSQFSDTVTLTYRMIDGTQDALLKKITELCRGAQDVSISDPIEAAF